ncbi:MAG: hypothetical protein F6K30_29515 [Cyanothece sp. SIO2G6]|nr:hypothetical protein [Cyanothece sp. SIO2G6]
MVAGFKTRWCYGLPVMAAAILGAIATSPQSTAITRIAPISVEMIINRVTGMPTLDLPPLSQRPTMYAELGLDTQTVVTSTVDTPQIGASAYPDWSIQFEKEWAWIEPGHPIVASIRIFDRDQGDADDKVLLRALDFDPVACRIGTGADAVRGDRVGSRCILEIPNLQGENGSARITLVAQW